jgi:hypothetical protein
MKYEMKMKNKPEIEDDLCSEYDLKSLRVRKFGFERENFAQTINLLQKPKF